MKMTTRRRSGSGSKRLLKEKVVQIYESLFKGEDLWKNKETFWDEFFLLKPKVNQLECEVQKITPEQLNIIKENINTLFVNCIDTLGHEHNIRVVHALQTLCALVHSIYKKSSTENGSDVITLIIGFEKTEERMQQLLKHCHNFLSGIY